MFIRIHTSPEGAKKRRKKVGVELPEGATVVHALTAYAEKNRVSYDVNNMRGVIILRNNAVARFGDVLEDGDEVTLLRVFAGG